MSIPNLKPVLFAQFWISIPVFILTEANLGILGLGVAEPLPSWGSLLRELESFSALTAQPWQFVPLILLIVTVSCFHLALQREELWATRRRPDCCGVFFCLTVLMRRDRKRPNRKSVAFLYWERIPKP